LRYVGSTYGQNDNVTRISGNITVDAALSYDINEHWTAGINARNVFGNEYLTTCYFGSCYYGDERSVLATVKYKL
jgi:iron complex outermembrane receptor protein